MGFNEENEALSSVMSPMKKKKPTQNEFDLIRIFFSQRRNLKLTKIYLLNRRRKKREEILPFSSNTNRVIQMRCCTYKLKCNFRDFTNALPRLENIRKYNRLVRCGRFAMYDLGFGENTRAHNYYFHGMKGEKSNKNWRERKKKLTKSFFSIFFFFVVFVVVVVIGHRFVWSGNFNFSIGSFSILFILLFIAVNTEWLVFFFSLTPFLFFLSLFVLRKIISFSFILRFCVYVLFYSAESTGWVHDHWIGSQKQKTKRKKEIP